MDVARIEELLEPFQGGERLDAGKLAQVSTYLELLLKWNAKMNLTSVRGEEEMVTRHFGESFFAARKIIGEEKAGSAIDLGSGAGFPGLPIAIYSAETNMTLVESQNRKATFLKEVVRALELKNVEVFYGRGEEYRCAAELVTLRAVEKFEDAAEIAARMVVKGGRLALMVGVGHEAAVPKGFEWKVGEKVPGSAARILMVGVKK
jgi:16S rRNA (guanine527-N7)-methyltransferase